MMTKLSFTCERNAVLLKFDDETGKRTRKSQFDHMVIFSYIQDLYYTGV